MQSVLYHALELFGLCLGIHVLVWRTCPVRNQGIRLGLIFLVLPVFALGAGFAATVGEIQWLTWGLGYVLHFALSGSYIFFYTAVSGASPSIAILERVENNMPHGLRRSDLVPEWFTDARLSGARRENLLATGFIRQSDGVLVLSLRGWLIAMCFLMFRRFLGLPDVAKG
jgi:hypothetical protein